MIAFLFDRAFKLMKKSPIAGDFVEFGVYRGDSLRRTMQIAKKYFPNQKITFYGFDTFAGMPETKVPLTDALKKDWGKGTFADTSYEKVYEKVAKEKVPFKLIKKDFKYLNPLSDYGIKKIRFAHIDADIYEGYKYALEKITPHIGVGTVILFDEYFAPSDPRFQSIRNHSMRAIREWEEKTGLNLHLIRFKWTNGLCVVVNNAYLKKYGYYIERLRNDNILQTAMDVAYQLSIKYIK